MRGINPNSRFKNLGVITSGFGEPTAQEAAHGGVDFANDMGTPIPAMTDGIVTKVEGGHSQGDNNFGNHIWIKDANGNTSQYNHLQNTLAKKGQLVKKNQQIATMGNTGATYSESGQGDGTHLDLRIVSAFGQYINPLAYLKNR